MTRRSFFILAASTTLTSQVAAYGQQPLQPNGKRKGSIAPKINAPDDARPFIVTGAWWYPTVELALQRRAAYEFLGKASAEAAIAVVRRTPTFVIRGTKGYMASTDFRHIFLTETLLMPTQADARNFAQFFEFRAGVPSDLVMIVAGYFHEIGHVVGKFSADQDCKQNLLYTLKALEVFLPEYLSHGAVERVRAKINSGVGCP